ncbi:uncharacterized protein N7459_008728 [Penicillium hispanicum]|uniref:uncharacterized protein n=1 Tax=Penicillium hispanicum TaxID=1080232 RepID=UPI002541F87C|nr:uncharacterized protein N7459_008728 [Penicillium hispanicum]KAJ5574301.1 hypothetical protein N7459_008728 [Penicillium hispanicum]
MGVSTDVKSTETPAGSSQANGTAEERPPSYNQAEQLALELPKLNLGESKSQPRGSELTRTVTRDQCVAHLKLLAVLADLRDAVSNDDGMFGLFDSDADRFPDSLNQARARIREKRWAVYTARAVDRYTKWWFTCLPMSRPCVTTTDMENPNYEDIIDCETKILWGTENLPPLDCIRYGKMSTWRTGFPFEAVNDCINDQTLEYVVGEKSQALFEQQVKLKWDNLHDPPTKDLECPRCNRVNPVLWTEGGIGESLQEAFKENTGYADASFRSVCKHCKFETDHGRLKVAKFRQDVKALLDENRPMPGSVFNLNGIPEGPQKRTNPIFHRCMMFPSRLMQACGKDLTAFTDPRLDWCKSIDDLRSQMEVKLRDKKALAVAHGGRYAGSVKPGERVHFRRMMSRYWDNFGPFALDLVGAVIRQGTFVQKMDNIDWLHSPTVMETADRLIKKYSVFLQIMRNNHSNMAVPTLDVDLAWHTHQLMPRRYYQYTTVPVSTSRSARQFIDHDDKVDENKLSEGFEWTSKMYRRATNGGIYSECTCWYCEATRAPDLYDRMFNIGSASRARDNADSLHDRQDISSNPDKNPHISAHNAVRPDTRAVEDPRIGQLQRIRLHRNYEKSVRRAEKRGRQRSDSKTTRDGGLEPMYYMPFVWGYPMYVPYYGPYMCDPGISSNAYACNPSCMNVSAGATGNCCAGTCGGGVAAGACGGAGSVACAGGSAACAVEAAVVVEVVEEEEEVVAEVVVDVEVSYFLV